jgi:hypothetical protein
MIPEQRLLARITEIIGKWKNRHHGPGVVEALTDLSADILSGRLSSPPADGGISVSERVAQITAHRACGNQEQDPMAGKLAGYCVVCQTPWPCRYAGTPPQSAEQAGVES